MLSGNLGRSRHDSANARCTQIDTFEPLPVELADGTGRAMCNRTWTAASPDDFVPYCCELSADEASQRTSGEAMAVDEQFLADAMRTACKQL
jgi:hypothetical protein